MIISKLLKKNNLIAHGFFGIKGGVSNGIYKSLNCGLGSNDLKANIKKNINIVCKKIKCDPKDLITLKQIHSKKIFVVRKINNKKLIGDGSFTNIAGIGLAVLTADCAPVIFFDRSEKFVGILHAGWKGAFKNIVPSMIKLFIKRGSLKKNIYVVIGPTISQKNYEVGIKFKKKFINKNVRNERFFLLKKDKLYFNLQGYISQQLKNYGIKNIEIIKKDTFDKKNNFFSARRSQKKGFDDYGRNISIIMIKWVSLKEWK